MRKTLGDQEMSVLAYVLDHEPVSLRDTAEYFADAGWARTTVHTVLERLRAKGYLSREQFDDVFKYRAVVERKALFSSLVKQFVRSRLGGSVSPLVAFLGEAQNLSDAEVAELRAVVEKLGKKE